MHELAEQEAEHRERVRLEMQYRLGCAFGRRRHPRVRWVSGGRPWWSEVEGPYRTRRAAARAARRLRDRHRIKAGYYRGQPGGRRKTDDWYVVRWVGEDMARQYEQTVEAVRAEAERFVAAVDRYLAARNEEDGTLYGASKHRAAMRRASMDLTRALVNVRAPVLPDRDR